jgi:SAM-dependent methyltransferase
MTDPQSTPTNRLLALMQHLGLARAHIATQVPADIAGLAAGHAERLGGVVLCVPTRLDPTPFAGLADRLLLIAGERGLTPEVTARAAERLPGARRHMLAGYDAPGWADVAAERTEELAEHMQAFLSGIAADNPRRIEAEGSHAGITYRVEGRGPALLLLPFFLAPSQWTPVIPLLSRRFTVVTLGGVHLGGVAALEDRARAPSYQAMFRTLVDLMAPQPGERILDVGCGAGSLDRLLARRLGRASPITAMDVNPFLLAEAAVLAKADGLDGAIRFERGSAEALPFPDRSFDHAFSVTVLEECDADRALGEMVRVVRPGGRVAVAVRAIDVPQWWTLELPEPIRRKVEVPPQSVAARGVADRGLYARLRAAGLVELTCCPATITLDRPDGPIWRYREDHVLSLLAPEELATWHAARATAAAAGALINAHVLHAAVGVRPASG